MKIMKNLMKYSICVLLFMLTSCESPHVDEISVAKVVKDNVSISGAVSAQKIKGGYGGSDLFLATDGTKNYVVKFIKNKNEEAQEIYNLQIASNGGYGPEVYFADPSHGIVIMEHLSGKTITTKDLQSDQLHATLVHLLQKIHQGEPFDSTYSKYDAFKRIKHAIQIYKPKYSSYIPLTAVDSILSVIHETVLPLLCKAPCHNDLHPGNLIFFGNECKAIDYGDAGPNDPYFDVATVAAITCILKQDYEKTFFTAYLEHEPSQFEEAKFYLINQVVLMKWAFDALDRLSSTPENILQYKDIQAPSFKALFKEFLDGNLDLDKPENNLKLLKSLLNQVIENAQSQEFQNALNLCKNKPLLF